MDCQALRNTHRAGPRAAVRARRPWARAVHSGDGVAVRGRAPSGSRRSRPWVAITSVASATQRSMMRARGCLRHRGNSRSPPSLGRLGCFPAWLHRTAGSAPVPDHRAELCAWPARWEMCVRGGPKRWAAEQDGAARKSMREHSRCGVRRWPRCSGRNGRRQRRGWVVGREHPG